MLGCLVVYFTSSNHLVIAFVLFTLGSLIYAPLALVGLMLNEAVSNYATAVIVFLVQAFGWVAKSIIIYLIPVFAIILLVYLVFKGKKMLAIER